MAASASVKVHNEVPAPPYNEWTLCFQECTWHYDDGTSDDGYRFIWRHPGGNLQPARGQARIPDATALRSLLDAALKAGWLS